MTSITRLTLTALVCTTLGLPVLAFAESHTDASGNPTGVRKELISSLDDASGKLIELAQAMPTGKYTWRPNKQTRSISEVYLHVAMANFLMPGFLGIKSPMEIDMKTFEKSTTDKTKIVGMLKDSFAHARSAIATQSDADLDQAVDMFGQASTRRGALIVLVNHAHEHLGQSIAYARSNNLTPPWTAREQAEASKKKESGR